MLPFDRLAKCLNHVFLEITERFPRSWCLTNAKERQIVRFQLSLVGLLLDEKFLMLNKWVTVNHLISNFKI